MIKTLLVLLSAAFAASAQSGHDVILNWVASTTPGVTYNVYRAPGACSVANLTFTKLNASPVGALTYTDVNAPGGTLCYQATSYLGSAAVKESGPSNRAEATIQPAPPGSLTIAPLVATVYVGTEQQYIASVDGSRVESGVRWGIEPQEGSINNSGLYTAPAKIQGNNVPVQVQADYQNLSATADMTLRKKGRRRGCAICFWRL